MGKKLNMKIRRKIMNNLELMKTANEVRKGVIKAVHSAKSGHPGGSLSAADIYTYLFFEELNVDPQDPKKAFIYSEIFKRKY